MPETIGTLDLKIAQLEHQLKLLKQQQMLSQAYPDHKISLSQRYLQVQSQLRQLVQYREALSDQARSAAFMTNKS